MMDELFRNASHRRYHRLFCRRRSLSSAALYALAGIFAPPEFSTLQTSALGLARLRADRDRY